MNTTIPPTQKLHYVTEAIKATLDFIFHHLKAHRVCLHTRDTNIPSQHVAERCGFTLGGIFEKTGVIQMVL